ncbi:IS1249 family transposase [Actinobaculum sp. 352]|uniref:IS1249 family transposase n=1 Tax=Actinobaculum sp. 352 TaxID=2490946 RepID=UPI000F7E8D9E|nr:IS1249 family transposase [Actinobaculum sp. 352]RTE47637.1 IS1249 family transposase [Actinobaculum sp. 352]
MKPVHSHARLCPICCRPCKKKGTTSAGTQRWYCKQCQHSFTASSDQQARNKQFREFLDYVTDTAPKRCLSGSIRTWDRTHAWCWDTRPIWGTTGQVYDQVFIDGTYIGYGYCLLVASTIQGVIAYQLCNRESTAAYEALLTRIPAPMVVTTDGGTGALAAIRACWPTTRIQRCLVHIQRNIRRVTTTRPKTEPHKALYRLGRDLTTITTPDHAITWQKGLAAFHQLYDDWLAEKTYRDQVPASHIPSFARHNKKWWYTHKHTRTIVHSLDRYIKDGVLFTFLDPDLDVSDPLASTTNPLEGGINAPPKNLPTRPPRLEPQPHAHRHRLLALHPLNNTPTTRKLHHQHHQHHHTHTRTRRTSRDRHHHQHPHTLGRQHLNTQRLGRTPPKITPTRRQQTHILSINPYGLKARTSRVN